MAPIASTVAASKPAVVSCAASMVPSKSDRDRIIELEKVHSCTLRSGTLAFGHTRRVSLSLLLLSLLGLFRLLVGLVLLHDLHGLLVERFAPRQVVEPVLRESVLGKVASSTT